MLKMRKRFARRKMRRKRTYARCAHVLFLRKVYCAENNSMIQFNWDFIRKCATDGEACRCQSGAEDSGWENERTQSDHSRKQRHLDRQRLSGDTDPGRAARRLYADPGRADQPKLPQHAKCLKDLYRRAAGRCGYDGCLGLSDRNGAGICYYR